MAKEPKTKETKTKEPTSVAFKILTVVGALLLVILIPLLACNVTLIVKSMINPNEVPDFFGYKPFIVLSGSMQPEIMLDDLVITKEVEGLVTDTDILDKFKGIGEENYRIERETVKDKDGNVVRENGFPVYVTEVVDGKTVPKPVLDDKGNPVYDYDANGNYQPEYVFDENGQIKRGADKYPLYKYGDSDIIAYHTNSAADVETKGVGVVVTHRIIEVRKYANGRVTLVVRGDNNNVSDELEVTYDMIEGKYLGIRVPFLGKLAMWLQEPLGLVIAIGAPLLLFVLWDVIRRKMYEKKERERLAEIEAAEEAERLEKEAAAQAEAAAKEAEMLAEIERLRAAASNPQAPPPAPVPAEQPEEEPTIQVANEAPAEVPAETPAEQPAEAPAEVPAETPAEQPAEAPAEAPAEPTSNEAALLAEIERLRAALNNPEEENK